MAGVKGRSGRKCKYPWELWLRKGEVTSLKQGRDFTCYMRSFIYTVYRMAAKRKVRVTIHHLSNERIVLTCQG